MTPEEITQAYDVLVQEGNDYAAKEAAKVGNSQRSVGGLAEAVANPSGQTSGLANYTYNRVMRPTVDTLAASLTATGKSQAMDRYLKDELMKAKNAYEDAKNRYTVAASTPKTTSKEKDHTVVTDNGYTVEKQPYTKEGTIIGTATYGNGRYGIIYADGKGGYYRKEVNADSKEEAKKKGTIIGMGYSGGRSYDVITADGKRTSYLADSRDDAKRQFYNDKFYPIGK